MGKAARCERSIKIDVLALDIDRIKLAQNRVTWRNNFLEFLQIRLMIPNSWLMRVLRITGRQKEPWKASCNN